MEIKYDRILDAEEQEIFVKYHIVETLEELLETAEMENNQIWGCKNGH